MVSPTGISPTPKPIHDIGTANILLSFYKALEELANGKKITKVEWQDNNIYGILHENQVMIKLADGDLHPWIISDGDLLGNDWLILSE